MEPSTRINLFPPWGPLARKKECFAMEPRSYSNLNPPGESPGPEGMVRRGALSDKEPAVRLGGVASDHE
jgi:hypothetical protein